MGCEDQNCTDSSWCAWRYINTIRPFSWAFEDRYINGNGNYPEISCIRDSPYPQKSAYSVTSLFFSFSRLVCLDHRL